ncbi:HERV-H LTR-associating 1 [Cricetulus griseus]
MSLMETCVSESGNKGLKKEKDGPFLPAAESVFKGEDKMVKWVKVLATTELPARSADLSALNLTELVNGMLVRALKDFTALLVDIVGNSTSYLTEIFKSTSILSAPGNVARTPWVTNRETWAPTVPVSVSQTMDDSTPKGPPWASLPSTSASPADTQQPRSIGSLVHPAGLQTTPSRLAQPSVASGCPQPLLKEGTITDAPLHLAMKKLNPCLMELCRFFQQCLCASRKRDLSSEAMR